MILENDRCRLELLTLQNYKYIEAIAFTKDLIYYSPSDVSTKENYKTYVDIAISNFENKTALPFIIFDKATNNYVGCTRFGNINHTNKVLHIGWTWISKKAQGTGLNKAVKAAMLDYAFNKMNFDKIEFRIDERNIVSRKAVEKLGAKLEGLLREDTLMCDGFKRSTCCYGILKKEWEIFNS